MLEQIREIIAENLAIDVEKVTESADFRKKTFQHSKQSAT